MKTGGMRIACASAVRCRHLGLHSRRSLKHINEVVEIIVAELREDDIPIQTGPKDEVEVFADERVAVTV